MTSKSQRRPHLALLFKKIKYFGVILSAIVINGCGDHETAGGREGAGSRLGVVPPILNLGELAPGSSAKAVLHITNRSSSRQSGIFMTTSCDCLTVRPEDYSIESGETAELTVTFDTTGEPGFRGPLAIEVIGKNKEEATLFSAIVNVTVE